MNRSRAMLFAGAAFIAGLSLGAILVQAIVLGHGILVRPCGHVKSLDELLSGADHNCERVRCRNEVKLLSLVAEHCRRVKGGYPQSVEELILFNKNSEDAVEQLNSAGYDLHLLSSRSSCLVLIVNRVDSGSFGSFVEDGGKRVILETRPSK